MFTLGFVKFDDKTTAWDGQTGPSNELIRLIRRYCKGRKHLIVQSADIKVIIEEKLVSVFSQLFRYAKCPMLTL
jgi:hypothetical protein